MREGQGTDAGSRQPELDLQRMTITRATGLREDERLVSFAVSFAVAAGTPAESAG